MAPSGNTRGQALQNFAIFTSCDRCANFSLFVPPLISYLHSATFEDGDLQHAHIYMYGLHIGDGGCVKAMFIVGMDLKEWQSCCIAGSRHQVATVAHEVVVAFVKSGVVGITSRYACGCT